MLELQTIAESLEKNTTLKSLNLESNYVSGQGIIAILEAINVSQTLTELRVANQVSKGFFFGDYDDFVFMIVYVHHCILVHTSLQTVDPKSDNIIKSQIKTCCLVLGFFD